MPKEIVFIDTNVQDYQIIASQVSETAEIVFIDSSKNGLEQISEWAQTHHGYDAMHIISHGSEGSIQLGNLTLNNTNLQSYNSILETIGESLTKEGDILLYGCNVANGQSGIDFISKLAQTTHADIAASTNLTGNEAKGGDWVLEKSTGLVSAQTSTVDHFAGLLGMSPSISALVQIQPLAQARFPT